MRIIFMGSPIFAVKSLAKLNQHHTILRVYTQPPRPAGRGMKKTQTAVSKYAEEHDIECLSPPSLKPQNEIEKLKHANADIFIVVAYGLILSQAVLNIPHFGCINGHASLLPRWRGAAPIQRAIDAGDKKTGVTTMQMESGLDTGPILHQVPTQISPNETFKTLHDRLADLTADCLLETLYLTEKQTITPLIQQEQDVCYAHKISKSETKLDFRQSAEKLERKIRAFSPVPSCWVELADGSRIKILEASLTNKRSDLPIGSAILFDDKTNTGSNFGIVVADKNILLIRQLQPAGKKPMTGADYLNGVSIRNGDIVWNV